ncbi:ATP-binding protein [Tepidibacillus marianensis]|uniref:ATP-binding protein n=1 Tax=Tepidibacillus marianensis TaxID=3131995 RepID=UPI0030D25B68
MSSEDLPFIFDRFYRSDKSRTRSEGGTGLGLSIAKWIVEAHKGEMSAISYLNEGTKMIIHLPTMHEKTHLKN